MKKIFILVIIFFSISTHNYSQDLKAGEITLTHFSGSTYKAWLVLYYNTLTYVNRPYVLIHWGDGGIDTLLRQTLVCGDTNTGSDIFIKTHTYSGPGYDTIWCAESFRMAGIQNMDSSENENLVLKCVLNNNPALGVNNSPSFFNCAHDFWYCCNWSYNCGAHDPDYDSLSYKLIEPFTTNYTFPPAAIDSVTGDLTFNPTETGFYSFCIKIDEWRHFNTSYILMGTTYRQIQIDVYSLTGINESEDSHLVNLFPNPFSTETNLETDFPLKNSTLVIEDCLGQIVKRIDNINEQPIVLSRENLSSGLYYVHLMQDNMILATKKIIIID